MIEFFSQNWDKIVYTILILSFGVAAIIRFKHSSDEQRIALIKNWLLSAVIEAETVYGGGTGRLKLSHVWGEFIKACPQLATWVSFEMFSQLVDEALATMKSLLSSNEKVLNYVYGQKEVEAK